MRPRTTAPALVLAVGVCVGVAAALTLTSRPSSPSEALSPWPDCSRAAENGTGGIVLLENRTTFQAPECVPFDLNESVTLVGSWNASEPTAEAVLPVGVTEYGWPCPGCYVPTDSVNEPLFPGSYDLEFVAGGAWVRDPVQVTRAIELVPNRATITLQPTGNLSVGPLGSLDWSFTIPSGASSPGIASSEQIQLGFEAGIMSPLQWAAFQSNATGFDWGSSAWFCSSSAGGEGSALSTGVLPLAPGSYYLVFYNDQTVPNAVDFTSPLYLGYTLG